MIQIDKEMQRLKEVDMMLKAEKVEAEQGELESAAAELTRDEAYAIAEFIDFNIFNAIRDDPDWDSMYALRNLIHAYEKCCWLSGYLGASDERREKWASTE